MVKVFHLLFYVLQVHLLLRWRCEHTYYVVDVVYEEDEQN